MLINLLPSYGTPPNTADPDNFDARADAKVAADVLFVEQMNTDTIPGINAAVEDVNDAMAAGLPNAATNAATATTKAGEASTSAANALAYRNAAQGFRDEAEYWAGVAEDAGALPPVAGQGGNFLRVKADESGKEWAAAGVRLVTEYLTSGTSWVAPANLMGGRVSYELVGGGASGSGSTSANRGKLGACGAYASGVAVVTPGSSYSYGVGAGGVAVGSSVNVAGNAGGATAMFGANAPGAPGPAAGAASTNTATVGGAVATGGDFNLPGATVAFPAASMHVTTGNTPYGTPAIADQSSGPSGYGTGGRGGSATVSGEAGRPGVIVLKYPVSI